MKKISESIKSAANKESVALKSALAIVETLDQEREDTVALLKRLEKSVGMVQGEEILTHIARMNGQNFNSVAYLHDTPNGGQ